MNVALVSVTVAGSKVAVDPAGREVAVKLIVPLKESKPTMVTVVEVDAPARTVSELNMGTTSNPGGGPTSSEIVIVMLGAPELSAIVTFTEYPPGSVLAVVVMERVDEIVPPEGMMTLVGFSIASRSCAMVPFAKIATVVKLTVSVNLRTLDSVIIELADLPAWMNKAGGPAVTLKPGSKAMIVVEFLSMPAVPTTVTV
jgi:hypothetical protein